jgi:hypothetical protein
MNRRALLAGVSTLAVSLAGCTSSAPVASDGVRSAELRRTGDCPADEAHASVVVDDTTVAVDGCITGPNGCAEARLDDATLDDSALRVVVESYVPDDAEACTQALVGRAYRATFELSDPPESVRVVHRGVGGPNVVARWP